MLQLSSSNYQYLYIFDKFINQQMQSNKKIQQFTIKIRRNNIQQKIKSLRSLLITEQNASVQNKQQLISSLSNGTTNIMDALKELKIMSWHSQTVYELINNNIVNGIFQILATTEVADYEYNQLLTILINVCAYAIVQVPNQFMKTVATSIMIPKRQASSLWFIANIIYQKSEYSAEVASELIDSCFVIQFMEKRLEDKFETQSDIIVFNFFCCSFLAVSQVLNHENFLKLLSIIKTLQQFENLADENFWYFSEALVDHGQHIGDNDYLIFTDPLFAKFHDLCKQKKTKFIKNYLKMLICFTLRDKFAYNKMLKYEIFNDLNYCLENRFPEVKKLCSQIGINLLENNSEAIDIDNIHFFSELSLEFIKFEKYDLTSQGKLLSYSQLFFYILTQNLSATEKQKLVGDLITGKAVQALCTLISTSNGNSQIIMKALSLIQMFTKIDQKQIILKHCNSNGLPQYLSVLYIQNEDLYKMVTKFLDNFQEMFEQK